MKGDSFCTAAFEGFGLVFRNLGRWSMLFLIGGMFNILGYLFISSGTGLVGYLLITRIEKFSKDLQSPIIPTMVNYNNHLFLGYGFCWICRWSHFHGYLWYFGRCHDALFPIR